MLHRLDWISACLVLLVSAAAAPADAAPAAGADADLADDATVTTASGSREIVVVAQRRRIARASAAYSVERVDRADAARLGARSAPELLEESTAVQVQTTNRGAGAPILRGLIGPSNMVMIDGLRYHQATWRTGPNQALATLEPSGIDAIDIQLGPASAAYGSSAMGGVIVMRPAGFPIRAGLSGDGSLRLHSADRGVQGQGRIAYRGTRFAVVAGGGLHRFGALRLGGGDVAPLSAYRQAGYFGRARYDLRDRTTLEASWLGSRLLDAGRADDVFRGDLRWYDNADDIGWLSLRHRGDGLLSGLQVSAAVHRSREDSDRIRCKLTSATSDAGPCAEAAQALHDDGGSAPAALVTRQNRSSDAVWTSGGVVQATLRPGWARAVRIDVGGELWHDRVDTSTAGERRADQGWTWADAARGNFSVGAHWTEAGAFALGEATVWTRGALRVAAEASARLSSFAAHADDVPQLGRVDYSALGGVAGAALRVHHGPALGYFHWQQGFRAPNLQETTALGDTGSTFEVPNAGLRPERSDTFELGARWTSAALRVHIAGWMARLSDAIDTREVPESEWAALGVTAGDVHAKPVRQRVNLMAGQLLGAQAAVEATLPWGVQPWLRLGLTHGDLERADGSSVPFRRVPPLGGAAGVKLARGRWSAEVFGRFAAAQDRLAPGDESDLRICQDPNNLGKTYRDAGEACPGTPAWLDLGARGGVALGEALRVDAVVRNVLDVRYRTHGSGVDAPGIGGIVTLSAKM